jgi:hypothetical protein
LGSIEAGKRADVLVLRGATGDPYGSLLAASETDVALVVIAGRPRFGTRPLLEALGVDGEAILIGGQARVAAWDDARAPAGDPAVDKVGLADATAVLHDVLARIPTLEADEKAGRGALDRNLPPSASGAGTRSVRLALHEQEPRGFDLRPHFPFRGVTTGGFIGEAPPTPHLPLVPLALDALTVVDDEAFLPALEGQANLPPFLKIALAEKM